MAPKCLNPESVKTNMIFRKFQYELDFGHEHLKRIHSYCKLQRRNIHMPGKLENADYKQEVKLTGLVGLSKLYKI